MFSLYGDLPAPKSKNDSSESSGTATPSTSAPPSTKPAGWSNMQQFRRPMMRKPTIQAKPKPLIPAGATIVSTTTVSKDPSSSPPPPAESTPPKPSSSPVLRPLQTKSYHSTADYGSRKKKKTMVQNQGPPPIDLYEDYDPLKPTDYEQYKEEMEILRQQRLRHSDDDDDIDDDNNDNRSLSPRHRGFAPPPDLYAKSPSPPPATFIQESGDEAYQRRAMMGRPNNDPPPPPPSTTSTAWKMMNKYGWQQGQGLGRTQDGIREALQVQARGDGSGVVLAPSRPSCVVVLKNMVGQVDDQLEQETAEECEKYGCVEQCVIYPLNDGSAVWIFIKFAHPNAAQAAVADLNGRYFDGRVVVAEEYDQDRFDRLDLAP